MPNVFKFLNFFKNSLIILIITILIILLIDLFFGRLIIKVFDPLFSKSQFYERLIRIDHPIYHHTLRKNVNYKNNVSFHGSYTLCTNNYGFKAECGVKDNKNFEYGIIGDSFAEGTPIEYEDTFVGLFKTKSNKKIANLGIVSYSPKIYLSKINYLLNQGFTFDHIIVFIDISDFYDDTNFYSIDENLIVKDKYYSEKNMPRRKFLKKYFPFTNFYTYVLKKITFKKNDIKNDKENFKPKFETTASLKAKWTYSKVDKIKDYDLSIVEGHKEMKFVMEQLYNLLNSKNIKMSVAVYPWPQQLQFDKVNSKHVQIWRDFCLDRCEKFINYFPVFFKEKNNNSFLKTYKKYYFWNDVHFNKAGNKLIADRLLKIFHNSK